MGNYVAFVLCRIVWGFACDLLGPVGIPPPKESSPPAEAPSPVVSDAESPLNSAVEPAASHSSIEPSTDGVFFQEVWLCCAGFTVFIVPMLCNGHLWRCTYGGLDHHVDGRRPPLLRFAAVEEYKIQNHGHVVVEHLSTTCSDAISVLTRKLKKSIKQWEKQWEKTHVQMWNQLTETSSMLTT